MNGTDLSFDTEGFFEVEINQFKEKFKKKYGKSIETYIEIKKNEAEETLKKISKLIISTKLWIDDGCKCDPDLKRIKRDSDNASKCTDVLIDYISEGEKIDKVLEVLTKLQARIFWILRGKVFDDNKTRIENDYHDAKRYIGYLFADTLIEKCRNKELNDIADCLNYFKQEYFDYLLSLHLEDYLRFKAYHIWREWGGVKDDKIDRMNRDYYNAMEAINIGSTFKNCKHRTCEEHLDSITTTRKIIEFLSELDLNKSKTAKINVGNRLEYNITKDVSDYTQKLYPILSKISCNKTLDMKTIEELISYPNTHVQNMLEFFLRCFLCTFLKNNA